MTDFVAGVLGNALGELVADLFGETLKERADRRALQRAIEAAVLRAEQQFALAYQAHDPELVQVLIHQTRFVDLPSVRAALRDLLAQPFHAPQGAVAVLRRSFADVLPERLERARVDAAVSAFLSALGREVLYIPQLRDLYALSFQKLSAESGLPIEVEYKPQDTTGIKDTEALKRIESTMLELLKRAKPDAVVGASAH